MVAAEKETGLTMKFLYILVSDENDIYYEQTLVSVVSLRRHNPNAFISLIVDDRTAENLTGFRASIKDLIGEYKIISFEKGLSNKVRSRHLKTNMRNLIEGDFLYIDGDTVIVEPLNISFGNDCDIAAVSDLHARENDKYRTKHKQFNKNIDRLNFSLSLNDLYFNSGVIYAKDSEKSKAFFDLWHKRYLYCAENAIYTDQLSFNESNHQLGFPIKEMSGEWNCQVREAYNHLYRAKIIYSFLCNAKIIHFFGSGIDGKKEPHPLMKNDFFEKLKKEQGIGEDSLKVIYNAKNGFYGGPQKWVPNVRFPLFFIYRQFPRIYSTILFVKKKLHCSI